MAKRIITLNESELKNLIKKALFELAGYDDDSDNDSYEDDILKKYDDQIDINKATGGKEYKGTETDIEDISDETEDEYTSEPGEPTGQYYICSYSDETSETPESWLCDSTEIENYKEMENCSIQGPFNTQEEAEKYASEHDIQLQDTEENTNPEDNEIQTNGITPLSHKDEEPEEHHQEGDVIYFENIPIEYKDGRYHMTIENGFDMKTAKCPQINVVADKLQDVKDEYAYLWDNVYYGEHGKYAQKMLDNGSAEYDFSGVMVGNGQDVNLEELPIIIDLDKEKK